MPGLHGTTLLSAPRIFALPNCFGPGFLRTACPLSLSLPVSFTFGRRLTIHLLHPLADLFLLFLALLLLLFLVLHSAPTFYSPPCLLFHKVLCLLRLHSVEPLHKITKRRRRLCPTKARIITQCSVTKEKSVCCRATLVRFLPYRLGGSYS